MSTKSHPNPSPRTVEAEVELEVQAERVDYATQLVGEIVEIDAAGCARVTFPGNLLVPQPARSIASLRLGGGESMDRLVGAPVLLSFEQADPDRPIILGVLRENLIEPSTELELEVAGRMGDHARVNGERIRFNADQEIILKCGRSSIHLRKDGKLVIRADKILSRASETHRIKGGSVSIN